jgi:hypothetical protein
MVAGSLFGVGGMYWLSRTGVNDSYFGHVFGAFIIAAFGLSLVSVPFVALGLSRVRQADSGEASSVVNVASLTSGLGKIAELVAARPAHPEQPNARRRPHRQRAS